MKKRSFKSPIILISLACVGVLIACGPYYAPRLLNYHSKVIEIPTTGIELMFSDNKKQSDAHRHSRNLTKRKEATLDADIADLKKAAPQLAPKMLERYSMIRKQMVIRDHWAFAAGQNAAMDWLDDDLLAALPKEFSLYHKGAVAYRSDLREKAKRYWLELLKLPAGERKYRSVWAAWMIARSSTAKGEGTRWYKKVLELKQAGFPDSLGVTEKDWTNYFAYRGGDYSTALSGYIREGNEGVIDAMEAARSVQHVFDVAYEKEQDNPIAFYKSITNNKDHAIAYSYYLKDKLSPSSYRKTDKFEKQRGILDPWVHELILSEREDKDKELGITATIAYALHDNDSLQLCLSRIKDPTIDSLWLKAKFETFEGHLTSASQTYQSVIAKIKSEGVNVEDIELIYYGNYRETGEVSQERIFWLYSEYASVELGLKNYGKALDLFIVVKNSEDAAYIAETLMTPTELLHHVGSSEVAKNSKWLKGLLSRKLMRNEYFKDAKPFILEEHLKIYDEYTALYRFGINKKNGNKERSEALEKAALLQRRSGSPLFSLEDGARPYVRIFEANQKTHSNYDYAEMMSKDGPAIPAITADELSRIKKNYIRISPIRVTTMEAAELLYRSAMLLPRNNDHAAMLFWKAGDWTRSDPQIADKYYQALVRRCWNTKLGKACDEKRWFIQNIGDF